MLAGVPVDLVCAWLICRPIDEPEETGATFEENARLKATYYSTRTRAVSPWPRTQGW